MKIIGKKIGITRGTFVLLTAGHCEMLEQARKIVDKLYVLIDGDEQVAQLKGRCIVPAVDRAKVLTSLKSVNDCFIFNDEFSFLQTVKRIVDIHNPDLDDFYYFKGGDYRPMDLKEKDFLNQLQFTICCLGHSGHSTTEIIKRIKNG